MNTETINQNIQQLLSEMDQEAQRLKREIEIIDEQRTPLYQQLQSNLAQRQSLIEAQRHIQNSAQPWAALVPAKKSKK